MRPPCLWPHRCPRQSEHFVPSSTPFLARFGLEALATVRVEEDTGAVPRSDTGSNRLGALRAQFQRRAVGAQPPVRTFCQNYRTQGAYRDRHGRGKRDAMDAAAPSTKGANADGQVVWSCPPDAGVKPVDAMSALTGRHAEIPQVT